ncbi:MAG: FtsX-like permease family protein, partial [Wenzhouxiangella sp.]
MPFALRNLGRNGLRSAMTVFGVAIGMALFVALLGMSNSFRYQIDALSRAASIDVFVQSRESATPITSRIDRVQVDGLAEIAGVEDAIELLFFPVRTSWNPYLVVIGVSSLDAVSAQLRMVAGALPEPGSEDILVGHSVAEQGYRVGQRLMLRESHHHRISGVFASEFQLLNGSVVMPLPAAQALARRPDAVSMVFLRMAEGSDQAGTARLINDLFPSLEAVPAGTLNSQMLLTRLGQVSALVSSLLALLAGGIFVSNTLVMSLTERIREIGVLMAIGWSRLEVMRTLLAEALLICLLG